MKIVVICENETLDRYVIGPVLGRLFEEHGKPAPDLYWERGGSIEESLAEDVLAKAFRRGNFVDAYVLAIDRDCDRKRYVERARLQVVRAAAAGKVLFACLAIEEVEVWALGLHRRRLATDWEIVRSECDPKESYFEPFARREGWDRIGVGKGRAAAMRALNEVGAWDRLKAACPELGALSHEIGSWLAERSG